MRCIQLSRVILQRRKYIPRYGKSEKAVIPGVEGVLGVCLVKGAVTAPPAVQTPVIDGFDPVPLHTGVTTMGPRWAMVPLTFGLFSIVSTYWFTFSILSILLRCVAPSFAYC